MRWSFVCVVSTCLRMCTHVTLDVTDVLHSSSVLTSVQTAGLIRAHTHTLTKTVHPLTSTSPVYVSSELPFLSVCFVYSSVHFCVSVFNFVNQCIML